MESPQEDLSDTGSAVGDILVACLDDWVSLGEARYLVALEFGELDPVRLREQTLTIVGGLVDDGLVELGDLAPRFVAWPLDAEAAKARLRRDWTDPEDKLLPGDVCWLANTPAGDEAAEQLREAT